MQVMVGKTTRAIEVRRVGNGMDAEIVAVTIGAGKKETLLGIMRDKDNADHMQVAAMIAHALEHETGHVWAYPGSDTEKGGRQ